MGVSKNNGTPKSSHFNRVFHYKPSILGVPLYLETPIYLMLSKDYPSQVKGMTLAHKSTQFASLKFHPLIPDSLLRKSLG